MSGICVTFVGPGRTAPDIVEQMLSRILHRARDGEARFALGPLRAGYARTRAKAALEEPFTDGAGRFCVLDGWIASRGELAKELGCAPAASDPELILTLLRRDGLRGL